MNIAVVGSRKGVTEEFVHKALDELVKDGWIPNTANLVSGGASGVDSFAESWAKSRGFDIIVIKPKSYDRLCLLRRDREIVDRSDKLVAFKSRSSTTKGTDYTYQFAVKKGIKTFIYYYPLAEGFD